MADYSKKALVNRLGVVESAVGNATVTPTAAEIPVDLTAVTHTAPGTPDYALQDFIDVQGDGTKGFAFHTKDEANTLLKVIANLQAQMAVLRAQAKAAGWVTEPE